MGGHRAGAGRGGRLRPERDGVRPDWKNQGLGSALLRPVIEECDRSGTPAYLEATCERNRLPYARHGFEDREPYALPRGGPAVFPMWRDPA